MAYMAKRWQISCVRTEKVKVMNENFDELKQIAQDAFDDGVLMEVSEEQMKKILFALIESLESPVKKK